MNLGSIVGLSDWQHNSVPTQPLYGGWAWEIIKINVKIKMNLSKKIAIIGVFVLIGVVALFGYKKAEIVQAFMGRYVPDQTIATTTPYQTFAKASAGAFATTTVNTDGFQDLTLLVMLGSSTTPPTVNYRLQYSPDGIDWYDEDGNTNSLATTTFNVSSGIIHSWTYSSTTANQTIIAGSNSVKFITKKILITGLDTAYTRIVWLNQAGGDVLLNVRPSTKNTYIIPK